MKKPLILLLSFLLLLPLCACQRECSHDWVLDADIGPTCTTDGYQEFKCSVCSETYRLDTGKATGHKPQYTNPETVKKATCTSVGVGKQFCSVCGEEYTVELPKKDHNYKDHICTVCGAAEKPLFFTDMKMEHRPGSEYITFSANIHNYTGKTIEYVIVTLELMDSKGNILDTDWTYAVGSEGLKDQAKAFFDIIYRGVSYSDVRKWSLRVKDYDISG